MKKNGQISGKEALISRISRTTRIYDTAEEGTSRFTVIIDGEAYIMNERPRHPQGGINQYVCEAKFLDPSAFGSRVRNLRSVPYEVLIAVEERIAM